MPLPTADGKRGRVMDGLISRQAAIDLLFDMANEVKLWEQVATDNTVKIRIEACKATLIEMKTRIAKLKGGALYGSSVYKD